MGEVERLMTVNRVAMIVSVHPETIRRAIRARKLGAYRAPGGLRISETDLKAYLDTYHCPASEMTSRTWSYVEANGPSSGGKKGSVSDFRQALRTKNALARR
ncbi:helix-turn-helix domain-containing protein [Kozakia baliensis]|uniref:helix-turn-helix domain-containing protein n=1 Tax=Kozakia baliensis TaxID=153496 RepID=UPI0009F63D71